MPLAMDTHNKVEVLTKGAHGLLAEFLDAV